MEVYGPRSATEALRDPHGRRGCRLCRLERGPGNGEVRFTRLTLAVDHVGRSHLGGDGLLRYGCGCTLSGAVMSSIGGSTRRGIVMRASALAAIVLALAAVAVASRAENKADPYVRAVLASRPVAFWPLGESAGRVATNLVRSDAYGAYVNGPALGVRGPTKDPLSTAVSFNGPRELVYVGNWFSFAGDVPFTAQVWMRPAPYQHRYAGLITKEQLDPVAGGQGWTLYVDRNTVGFDRVGEGTTQDVQARVTLPTDSYTQIAGEFDGSTMSLIINGRLVAAKHYLHPLPLPTTAGGLAFGRASDQPASYFYGDMADVSLFARAVPLAEIARQIRAAGVHLPALGTPLVAHAASDVLAEASHSSRGAIS